MTVFEYDPAKSATNKDKHGIDFDTAQELWAVSGVVLPSPFPGELRHLRVALFEGRLWTAIYTHRGDTIRIISVRRSRKTEENQYGHQNPTDRPR